MRTPWIRILWKRFYEPVTFVLYGLPLMCLSANLTEILYSPGAVGKYVTETVPSLLSWQLMSALLGPSTANERPPAVVGEMIKSIFVSVVMDFKI